MYSISENIILNSGPTRYLSVIFPRVGMCAKDCGCLKKGYAWCILQN